jgi:hypothetical protein
MASYLSVLDNDNVCIKVRAGLRTLLLGHLQVAFELRKFIMSF